MKYMLILLLIPFVSKSATIEVNGSEPINLTGVTKFTCNGLMSTFEETSECCTGSSCDDQTDISLDLSSSVCPKIVIDGYLYSTQSDINLIHTSRTFSVTKSNISNCRRADNSFPSVGSLNESNLTTNNAFFGVKHAYMDVDLWRLIISSKDGDLTCNGAEGFVDVIFESGYESD